MTRGRARTVTAADIRTVGHMRQAGVTLMTIADHTGLPLGSISRVVRYARATMELPRRLPWTRCPTLLPYLYALWAGGATRQEMVRLTGIPPGSLGRLLRAARTHQEV